MLFRLRIKAQLVYALYHLAQVIAALQFVVNLAKNLTDFVFNGVGASGALLKAFKVGEQL